MALCPRDQIRRLYSIPQVLAPCRQWLQTNLPQVGIIEPSSSHRQEWAFTGAILALGKRLGLTVVAEGIETELQLKRLRELGCELGQGFLFSPAVEASQVESLLATGFRI